MWRRKFLYAECPLNGWLIFQHKRCSAESSNGARTAALITAAATANAADETQDERRVVNYSAADVEPLKFCSV